MDKIQVMLEVPSVSKKYEMEIPVHLKVKNLIPLLVQVIVELTDGLYVSSGNEFLCASGRDILLDEDSMVAYYDIKNGDHLMMI